MNRSFAITSAKLLSLFEVLEEYGIKKEPFLDSLNIDASLFDAHENKLTVTQVKDLFEKAISLTGNHDLGLHIGLRARFLPNIVCYIMMNCLTVREALEKYSQYKRIFSDETNVRLTVNPDKATLNLYSISQELTSLRSFSDYKLTSMYIFLRFLTGGKFNLTRVTVRHDKPDNISEYEKVFPCPISFSQPDNSLVFNAVSLNHPISFPNKDLLNLFEQYAKEILAKISTHDSLPKKVSQILINILQRGDSPSVELIAMKLNMSIRKLQGLLEQERTTYKQLLHSVKKELAFSYLSDSQLSPAEVSYLLGFSEPSAFYRAFKKWTGNTPGQFRATQ